MGKFSNILIASDFDRTLTDPQDRIPQVNLDAIRYFIDEGGIFTVASGRSIPLFRQRAALVPVNAPCILSNGAILYDYTTETLQRFEPLDEEFAPKIIAAARAYDNSLSVEVQCLDAHYIYGADTTRDRFLAASGVKPIHVEKDPPFPWMKIVVCATQDSVIESYDEVPPEKLEKFRLLMEYLDRFCREKCYVTRSMPRLIEIGANTCNKGTAARALAKSLDRKTLVCIGDAMNDISMLREADYAFSPADCDPALRNQPFFRGVAPCGDGSVASAIAALEELLY